MSETCRSTKGVFEAVVSSNKQIGPRFYKLKLTFSGDGAKAFAAFQPGQFAELDVSGIAMPPQDKIPPNLADASGRNLLLRRPFSFTDVTIHGDTTIADLLYCIVGPASLRMTTLSLSSPRAVDTNQVADSLLAMYPCWLSIDITF